MMRLGFELALKGLRVARDRWYPDIPDAELLYQARLYANVSDKDFEPDTLEILLQVIEGNPDAT